MLTASEHQEMHATITALPLSFQLDVAIRLIRWQLRCDTSSAFIELAERIKDHHDNLASTIDLTDSHIRTIRILEP